MTDPGTLRRTRAQRVMYICMRTFMIGFCKAMWRVTYSGTEHVPATGGFIIAPVHRSNIDPFPLIGMTRRRLSFLGKDSLWKTKITAWFFTTMGGYPVKRGVADREALKRCIEVLNRGEGLLMFPEGTRQFGPVVQELFDGTAYVAAKSNVPILPLGIGGSEFAMPKGAKMLRPVKIHFELGPPIYPTYSDGERATRDDLRETTARLSTELQALFDVARAKAGRA